MEDQEKHRDDRGDFLLMNTIHGERFDLQSKHLVASLWLIALILPLIITIPAFIGGKRWLLAFQMTCMLAFQIRATILKKRIKKLDKVLLVKDILES
jgi:hypothetical protein